MRFLISFTLAAASIISGCGGGGSGNDSTGTSTPLPTVPPPPPPVLLFEAEPVVLPDPSSYYSTQACVSPEIQFVIPVVINDDEKKDFIVHYWCELPRDQWGSDVTTPTPDLLVAFLSNGLGGYEVANEAVFGESFPKLGGASRKYATGDMNSDGRPDFAFAMNYEDGRSGSAVTPVFAKPAVLLSSDNEAYTVHQLGNAAWGHAVDMVNNNVGTQDALFAGFSTGAGAIQAFRLINGVFQDASGQYPAEDGEWANTFRFIQSAANEATLAVGSDTENGQSGVTLWSKSSGDWQKADSFFITVVRQQDCINWNGDPSTVDVLELSGTEYFFAAIDELEFSEVSLTGSDEALVVAKLSGALPPGGTLDPNAACDQNEMSNVNIFFFLKIVDEQLVLIDEQVFVNPNVGINANFYDVIDINNDDLPDLVVQAFTGAHLQRELGGIPDVYLNTGGTLLRRDTSDFPGLSNRNIPSQGYLHDIDRDGYYDLVLFALKAGDFGEIEIYTANDHIN